MSEFAKQFPKPELSGCVRDEQESEAEYEARRDTWRTALGWMLINYYINAERIEEELREVENEQGH
jgi:hypothetical protein